MTGVLAEGSGFQRDQVYVWALAMPLFTPVEYVTLSQSRRVHPSRTFGLADPDALAGAVRDALAGLQGEEQYLAMWAADIDREVGAYSLVLLDQEREAVAALADARLAYIRDGRDWALETVDRLDEVASAIRDGGMPAARSVLTRWRSHTAAALKLRN